MVIALIAQQRQYALAYSCEGTAIDRDTRKRADDGLGGRAELLRSPRTVAIEVFFEHQFATLVEQDAVYIFVSAVEDGVEMELAVTTPRSDCAISPTAIPSCRSAGGW